MKTKTETKTGNIKKYLGIPKKDMPAVLLFSGDTNDPNLQDVLNRDKSKYLLERYWIKQWSPSKRWKNKTVLSVVGWNNLRLKNLGRKLNDPGDAFFRLFLFIDTFLFSRTVRVCTWVEVTEAVFPETASKLNQFIRGYNGLREKEKYDKHEYIKSFIKSSFPSPILQYKMANRVIELIKQKAQKGKEGGSYQHLVSDYGTGVLIVGIPLWFATPPINPKDPSNALYDFCTRLSIGLNEMKHSVLNTKWCPFDSIYVVWNPNLKSIDSWAETVDSEFYSDISNVSWKTPVPIFKMYSFLKENKLEESMSSSCINIRYDRYSSLNAALKEKHRLFRLSRRPKPFGPKSCLEVIQKKRRSIKNWFSHFLLQKIGTLFILIRFYGFHSLWQLMVNSLSPIHFFKRIHLKHQMKKMYYSKPSIDS